LLFVEVMLRIGFSNATVLSHLGQERDAFFRLWWVQRHRDDTPIRYRFDVYSPTRGWVIKPNLHDMPVFHEKILNSNARGLRGRTDYSYDKPAARRRVVVLGDSWTFGEQVSDDETYAAQLSRVLRDIEVLNFGVHGYGHDQMLIYLQEEALNYHPDLVIVGFEHFDIYRNLLSFRDFAKPRYVLDGTRLVLTHSPVPSPESVLRSEPYRVKLLDGAALLYQSYRWLTGDWERDARRITTAILSELVRSVLAVGAVPLFVDLGFGGEDVFFSDLCNDINNSLPTPARLRCISARAALAQRAAQGEQMAIGGHPSPEAHRTIAHVIRDYLVRNELAAAVD